MDERLTPDEFPLDADTDSANLADASDWDDQLLADDLEQAYLRALEATDAVEREMNSLSQSTDAVKPSDTLLSDPAQAEVTSEADVNSAFSSESPLGEVGEMAVVSPSASATVSPSSQRGTTSKSADHDVPRVSEKQVVEAALFVGGMSLTAKKLSTLFHTDHGFGFVECLIDELNRQYADEGRPYSILLGEGGYRLALLPEFEPVRNRVFGYGPKDVKLTQDALEVLSLVAYRQPITKSQIESLGKSNPGPLLRQLLQRELIRIDRAHSASDSQRKSDPPYSTTPRFLSLFGIGHLRELPVAEDIQFK